MSLESYMKAIEALSQRGENPTLEAIRKEAGGGSFSTITAARRFWQSRQLMPHTQLAAEVPASLTTCVAEIWRKACELADANVAIERGALAAARQEVEQGQAELCETADRLAAEAERLASECGALQTERDMLRERLDKVTAERDAVQALLTERLSGLLPLGKPAKPVQKAVPESAGLESAEVV